MLLQEKLTQLIIGLGIILVLISGIFFTGNNLLSQDLEILEQEVSGIELLKKLQDLNVTLQQIRGLENIQDITRDKSLYKTQLQDLKQEVLKQIRGIHSYPNLDDPDFKKQLATLLSNAEAIVSSQNNSNKQLFDQYSSIIDDINEFFVTLGDKSKLLFDPERNSYFVMILTIEHLPKLIEDLAKVRGYGSGLIAKKSYTTEERYLIMHFLQSNQSRFKQINHIMGLLLENEQLQKILRLKRQANTIYRNSVSEVDLIENQIFQRQFSISAESFFNRSTKLINDTHALFIDAAFILNEQLEKRKESIQQKQLFNLIFLLCIGVGLIIGGGYFYYLLIKRIFNQELETQLDQLNEKLLESDSFYNVCEISLSFVSDYFSVLNGILYLYNEQNKKLYLSSVYAENEKELRKIFPLGDGVIGQTAKDGKYRQQFFVNNENKADIGLFQTQAKIIITYPVFHQQQVVAVVQLATDKPFDKNKKILMERFLQLIASRIHQSRLVEERSQIAQLVDKYIITSKTNENGFITSVSQAFVDISGYSREELIGNQHSVVRHPDMPKTVFKELWKTIKSDQVWHGEIKNRTKQGGFYWVEVSIFPDHDFYGNIIGFTAIRQDITDKKRIEELSITDPMTGLYNRRYFDEKFKEMFAFTKRERKLLVFGIMDVDHFKQYNDYYGHQKGDLALISIAGVLKLLLKRPTDYAFRLGGEEFGILFFADDSNVLDYVNDIRNQVEKLGIEHTHNTASNFVTLSIGLFVIDLPCDLTEEQCYRLADKQLYWAKNNGRNNVKLLTYSNYLNELNHPSAANI